MAKKTTPPLELATSRYYHKALIEDSGLAPVGTTVGFPKFPLGYHLEGICPLIAPKGVFGKDLPEDEFRLAYTNRLNANGSEHIEKLLRAIADAGHHPGCVLLCFCDLTQPDVFCHRRMFAEWWEEQTGRAVPELRAGQLEITDQEEEEL
jgi:hypothetical protein